MTSTAATILHSLATTLLLLLLIGWAEQAAVHRSFSPPLRSPDTYRAVAEVSQHAQSVQTGDGSDVRLMPRVTSGEQPQDPLKICCLHAYILDFYLHHILPHNTNEHPKIHRVHSDFHRISTDLTPKTCNVTLYHDHQHVLEFRRKFNKLGGEEAVNKALGEIDILFSNLHDFCV